MSYLPFLMRYKLAQTLLARGVWDSIISKNDFLDMISLSRLQHDGGFFVTAYRVINTLSDFDTSRQEDAELFRDKVLEGQTIFFHKRPLEEASEFNYKDAIENLKSASELAELQIFDKLLMKSLYDTYFMAYAEPTGSPSYQFLDETFAANVNSGLPANAFGAFSSEDLENMSSLLDVSNNDIVVKLLDEFRQHPQIRTYKQFLFLAEKHILSK